MDKICEKVQRKFVERNNGDYSIKSIQSLERAQGTTNRRNLEEEQSCHPPFDIHHAYEQIKSELNVVKDELERSNHVIQELKVQNAKLNYEKDVGLEKLETTIEDKDDLKAEVDRLNYFESFLLKEIEQKEAEIAKQTEICLKAESESQQENAANDKLKCENHILLQNLDITMKDRDDFKLQCNELKKSFDTKLGEIEENKREIQKQKECCMQVETEIQELKVENEELKCENKDRNELKILSDKLEYLNANLSEKITEKVNEIQKQT